MNQVAEIKTILVSDLVSSSNLVAELGDAKAAALFERHDVQARALLERFKGREIDKSDGFLLLFSRPISAVRYAIAYHEALAELSHEVGLTLDARVGIHLGELILRENPADQIARGAKPLEVEGLAKVVAARLMALAGPRQTLLTRTAFDLTQRSSVGHELIDQLEWRLHSSYQLAGVAEPVEVCEVGVAGSAPLIAPRDTEKAHRIESSRPGIVVMPFVDISGSNDTGHVSDGVTDEIITSLSTVQAIRVISRSASMQLKGKVHDIAKLSQELNVQYVLDGTVRRSNGSLRITAQLARSKGSEVVWANKYTGELDHLFDIGEDIARTVVDALALYLDRRADEKLAKRPIPNVAAFEYYLRAKQEIYRFTEEALDRALDYLEKGLAILGDNIPIQAAMGYVYWQYVNAGIRPDPSYLDKARACAQRIFDIDSRSPDAHRLMGLVEIHAKGDLQKTANHLKLALAGDPNDTDALCWLSFIYGFAGRPSSGYPLTERLLEIDPLTPFHWILPAYLSLLDGDFERARPQMLKAYELNDRNPAIAQAYGQLLVMSGDHEAALSVFERMTSDEPDSFFTKLGLCYRYALRDRERLAIAVTPDLEEGAATDAQYSWSLAECFALAGDVDRAIEWLSNAVKFGNWNYPLLAQRDPLLENLRSDERYQRLMQDVKRKWVRFEV